MRFGPPALGAICFVIATLVSYRVSQPPPPVLRYQPAAIPVPAVAPPASAATPTTQAAPVAAPEFQSVVQPPPLPVQTAVPPANAPAPLPQYQPAPTPAPTAALPDRYPMPPPGTSGKTPKKSRKTAASAAPTDTSVPGTDERPKCLLCNAPADSWVEVDGVKQGYCRKHYSHMDRPRTSRKSAARTPAPAPVPEPETSPGETADTGAVTQEASPEGRVERATPSRGKRSDSEGSVQCRGFTKTGQRCHRKTKDPSGFCYQHRPR